MKYRLPLETVELGEGVLLLRFRNGQDGLVDTEVWEQLTCKVWYVTERGYVMRSVRQRRVKGELCYCLMGGIYKVAPAHGSKIHIRYAIEHAIGDAIRVGSRYHTIIGFNDSDLTEWKDVEQAIFRAIRQYRNA
jgi:hypothetical protein